MREHANKRRQRGQQLRGVGELPARNNPVRIFQQEAQQHHTGPQTDFPALQDRDDDGTKVIQHRDLRRIAVTLRGKSVKDQGPVINPRDWRDACELHWLWIQKNQPRGLRAGNAKCVLALRAELIEVARIEHAGVAERWRAQGAVDRTELVFLQKIAGTIGLHFHQAEVVLVVSAGRCVLADGKFEERRQHLVPVLFVLVVGVAVDTDSPAAAAAVFALGADAAEF